MRRETKLNFISALIYLCTFAYEKIYVGIAVKNVYGETTYYVKRSFLEAYPMVVKYIGEPSLFSFAPIEQWLQNNAYITLVVFKETGGFLYIFCIVIECGLLKSYTYNEQKMKRLVSWLMDDHSVMFCSAQAPENRSSSVKLMLTFCHLIDT